MQNWHCPCCEKQKSHTSKRWTALQTALHSAIHVFNKTHGIMGWYWICNNSQDRFQLQLSRIVNCKLPKMDIGRFPLRKQHGKLNVFSCEPPPQTGCFCGTPGRGDEVAKDTILSFLLSVFHTRCHCARHCKPRLSCSRRDCAALQTGLSHALRLLGRYFLRSISV